MNFIYCLKKKKKTIRKNNMKKNDEKINILKESLYKKYGESFYIDCNNYNVAIKSENKDECEEMKKSFDIYKNTGAGRFFSDYNSCVVIADRGYILQCTGNIQMDKVNKPISWTTFDFFKMGPLIIFLFCLLSYIFK